MCKYHLPGKCERHWVYVVGCRDGSGPFKVGMTKNLSRRVGHLRSTTRKDLAWLYRIECRCEIKASDVEGRALAMLAPKREYGDWFNCELHEAVSALNTAYRRRR